MDDSTELRYLRFIYANIDMGPSHGDVIEQLQQQFENTTGTRVPAAYRDED